MFIQYWKGVVVPDAILSLCEKEIEQLKARNYKSLNFEKLYVSGETLYSIRVNKADRLIMTEHAGALVVLEYVAEHDYAGCRFLRGGGVRQYLELKLGLTPEVLSSKFEVLVEEELRALEERGHACRKEKEYVEFHGRHWVEISEEQEQATYAHLPLLVSGVGGAGKSTIALSMLLEAMLSSDDDGFPCLYITKEPRLVVDMQRAWRGMSLNLKGRQDRVRFLKTDSLVEILGLDCTKVVKEADFFAWWKGREKKAGLGISANKVWEELCICASCADEAAYQAVGQRQSQLSGEQKEALYQIYVDYTKQLADRGLISLELLRDIQVPPSFSLIFLDEAQNIPPALLKLISRLAIEHKVVYFSGEQQSINSSVHYLSRLKEYYHQQGVQLARHHLTKTYRCPQRVSSFVTEMMRLKRQTLGGTTEKEEQLEMYSVDGAAVGRVAWLEPSEIQAHLDEIQAQRADFAVVTLEEYVEEVQRLLPDAVVFTVSEAQGLGIRNLLIYRVFVPVVDICVAALSREDCVHRVRRDELDLSYSQDFDRVITALTRAEANVTIVEREELRSAQLLKKHFAVHCGTDTSVQSVSHLSTDEEWERQALEYHRLGYKAQALQIWCQKLKRSEESFPKELYQDIVEKLNLTNEEPMVSVEDEFVQDWVANIPPKHIMKHIEKLLTHRHLSRVLMDISVSEYDCLLTYLFKNEQLKDKLLRVAETHKIFSCVQQSSGRHGIDYYVEHAPMFLLEKPQQVEINLARVSRWLASGQREFLQKLVLKSAKHMKRFCAEVIQSDDVVKVLDGQSVLEWLMADKAHHAFLTMLVEMQPKLQERIPAHVLVAQTECVVQKSKEQAYIENWLKKSAKLNELLQQPNISVLLMDIPVGNYSSLFEHILHDERLKLQLKKLGPSVLEKLLSCRQAKTGKYAIDAVVEHFSELLDNNPQAISLDFMTAERVCHWLMGEELSFFDNLLRKSAKHLQKFCEEALFVAFPPNAGVLANVSPLYYLAKYQKGAILLNWVFKKKPHLMQKITADILCLPRTEASGSNTSSLYWLARNEDGQNLLEMMFNQNPNLIKGITAEALCALVKESEHDNTSSVFYWLVATAYEGNVPELLFEQNPNLIKGITVEALCSPYKNESALYHMTLDRTGLLRELFEGNPLLIKQMKSEALYTMCRDQELENTSAFSSLVGSQEDGKELLVDILHQNPELIQGLSVEVLCAPRNVQSGFENETPLFDLSKTEEGIQLLQFIFEQKPELIGHITVDNLCLLIGENNTHEELNSNPMYYLSTSPDGIGLLKEIFNTNPNIMQGITAQTLCLLLDTFDNKNTSILYELSQLAEGHALLLMLLNANPALQGSVDLAFLQAVIVDRKTNEESSILAQLATTEVGLAVQSKLMRPPQHGMFFAVSVEDDSHVRTNYRI